MEADPPSPPDQSGGDEVDILFVITDLAVGGAENQVQAIALRLSIRGWKVTIVSMMPPSISTGPLTAAGISVEHLAMSRGSWNPRAIARLRRVIRRRRPRLIHSHMVHANLLARLTKPMSGMRTLICTSHNINEGSSVRTWALRLTDSMSDMTTHVSKIGLSRYLGRRVVGPDRALWIPNGVDLERFAPSGIRRTAMRSELGIEDGRFLWLIVASLVPQKAHDRLLHAFAHLPDDPVLAIAGEGPASSQLHELAERLGVQSRVRFLGVRPDPEALMNAADGFVLSSRWEGLPLVLMEAAASGLPIVSTDVGGCRELVEDGVTGSLVTASGAWDLGEAMRGFMRVEREELEAIGASGRALMTSRYDIEAVVTEWEDLYRSLS